MISYANFYRSYRDILNERYPSHKDLQEGADLERLASPHRIQLPKKLAQTAQAAITAHYQLAQTQAYRRALGTDQPWLAGVPARTDAVLMAYDFHTTAEGGANLVEVNTNSAAYLLSDVLYRAHGLASGWGGKDALESLREAFAAEAAALGRPLGNIVIVDDAVAEQRMLIEFFMYRDWFRSFGCHAEIAEAHSLEYANGKLSFAATTVDFVYNRLTDFYFNDPRFTALRQAYLESGTVVSPHPWAYHLFADKARLVELSEPGWLEKIGATQSQAAALRAVLIPTFELKEMGTAEEVWANRKNLFFKPRRSHGAKSVYRGGSVSRRVFERLLEEETLVQIFVPAQSWKTSKTDSYMENWKFDLRVFTYRDRIQLAVARSYQGQVTNFSSRYGGLTAVEFV